MITTAWHIEPLTQEPTPVRGRLVLMQKAREEDTTVQEEREPDAKKVKMEEM